MRNVICLVLIFSFTGSMGISQDCDNAFPSMGPKIPGEIQTENEHFGESSPYLYDDWRQGAIYFTNGRVITDLQLRYRSATDKLAYFNRNENYTIIVESNYIKEFTLVDPLTSRIEKFRRLAVQTNYFPHSNSCITQILCEGKVSLYALRIKQKQNSSGSSQSQTQGFSYSKIDLYYLQLPDKNIMRIKPSRKEVLNVLSDRRDELKEFIKKKHLHIRKEADLIKVIDFYNLRFVENKM